MSQKRAEYEKAFMDFRGANDCHHLSHMIFDNQLVQTQNVNVHHGGLQTVSGFSNILTSTLTNSKGLSMYRAYDLYQVTTVAEGQTTLFQLANGKLYRIEAAGAIPYRGSANCIYSGVVNWPCWYAQANRKVYVADGQKHLVYSGNQASPAKLLSGSAKPPESCNYLIYHQDSDRLFAGNGSANFQRVWYSQASNYESWPATNYFDIPESRIGDVVKGFGRLFGKLVIFGAHTISVLYGRTTSDYQLRTLDWNTGCPFEKTIVDFDEYIVFLGVDGIYKFDGNGPATRIDENIRGSSGTGDIWNTGLNTYGMAGQPCACRSAEGWYLLSYRSVVNPPTPTHSYNNQELIGRPPSSEAPYWSWEGPHTKSIGAYARGTGTGDFGETWVLAATGGKVGLVKSVYTYTGSSYDCDVFTKQYDLGRPFTKKQFVEIEIHADYAEGAKLQTYYRVDNNTNWEQLKSIELSKNGPIYGDKDDTEGLRYRIVYPLEIPDYDKAIIGNYIQLRFKWTGNVTVLGFCIRAKDFSPAMKG